MLVLSRERDEEIIIEFGKIKIRIQVVDIRGNKTRIGIDAPEDVAIHRKEIYDAIKRENEQAACLKEGELGTIRPHLSADQRSFVPRANGKVGDVSPQHPKFESSM